jgi:Ca-activated chloride channel family protein
MMKRCYLIFALCVAPLMASAGQSSINQGIRLLNKGKLDQAAEVFSEAKGVDPALAQYNLGNARYRSEEFVKAAEAYQNAQHSLDETVQQYAAYNAGNALLTELVKNGDALKTDKKVESAKAATELFKKAIELDPSDRAAKQNYERAKKLLDQLEDQQKQEQEQQQQDQQNQDDKKDQQKSDQENQDQNQDDQEPGQDEQNQEDSQQDQQDQEQQNQESEDSEDQQQNQQDQQQGADQQQDQPSQSEAQPQNSEQMTEQEARQVLDSMKQDEQDKRPTIMYGRPQRVEKDW